MPRIFLFKGTKERKKIWKEDKEEREREERLKEIREERGKIQ